MVFIFYFLYNFLNIDVNKIFTYNIFVKFWSISIYYE